MPKNNSSTQRHELTAEEKRFIVQTLQQLELRGNAQALRQAVILIDSITAKLDPESLTTNHQ